MKHLLRSIESRSLDLSHTSLDITQLLTNVRDTRDLKSVDGFTEAMEKVLQELRSTEHAVPFLKPVKRSEAPNYDIIIENPMDLHTMGRKVKQHAYKTVRDFANDLNLIWDNCLKYNSEPTHPLRRSTVFMRKKADQSVERYLGTFGGSDRPVPVIPSSLNHHIAGNHLVNGHLNGLKDGNGDALGHRIRIKLHTAKPARFGTETPTATGDEQSVGLGDSPLKGKGTKASVPLKGHRRVTSLSEVPAIIRTPQTMKQYHDLDYAMQPHLDTYGAGPSNPSARHAHFANGFLSLEGTTSRLKNKLASATRTSDDQAEPKISSNYSQVLSTGMVRIKRLSSDDDTEHPAKRPHSLTEDQKRYRASLIQDGELLGDYWGAVESDNLFGNTIPIFPQPPRIPNHNKKYQTPKGKRRRSLVNASAKEVEVPGLKGTVYKNIDALRRIRRTHTALLTAASRGPAAADDDDEDIDPSSAGAGAGNASQAKIPLERKPDALPLSKSVSVLGSSSKRRRGTGTALEKERKLDVPLEGGQNVAGRGMRTVCAQLLEHSGFEGSSDKALEMLTHVAEEYIMKLGRTLRFLTEQRNANTMTSEEIILHTLAESGIPGIGHLESYIRDDVERYGGRLQEIERRLNNAWQEELDAEENIEYDDGLAEDDDALISGDFSLALGDDFFGLRNLGLDKELGLSSLSVPSRLFHGHAKKKDHRSERSGDKEPVLPFPPPEAFVLLNSHKIDAQIGLLRPFYRNKFDRIREKTAPPAAPSIPAPALGYAGPQPYPPMQSALGITTTGTPKAFILPDGSYDYNSAPEVTLGDDGPDPLHVKMGITGQITVPTSAQAKKKAKASGAGKNSGANTGNNNSAGPANSTADASGGSGPGASTSGTGNGGPPGTNGVGSGSGNTRVGAIAGKTTGAKTTSSNTTSKKKKATKKLQPQPAPNQSQTQVQAQSNDPVGLHVLNGVAPMDVTPTGPAPVLVS